MLKPLTKQAPTNDSERLLDQIATKTFFSLWSYPGIYRDVSGGKEVADLTVYFNKTLIIFSDKGEVKFQNDKPVELAWQRWYRTAVKESAKQLHGAEKFIKEHPSRVFLNQSCTDLFPYDLSDKDLKFYLVCVTRGVSLGAKKYWDSIKVGSAGTLKYSYHLDESEIQKRPFTIGDVNPDKTFINVIDEVGLSLLLSELATPADFINYLQCKEAAIRGGNLIGAGGEEDLLAYYLGEDDGRGFGAIKHPTGDVSKPYMIHEWMWREFRRSPAYMLQYAVRKSGEGWAKIISTFSDSVVTATVGEGRDLPLLNHAEILQHLASENMVSRGQLASALYEKFNTVPEFARSARLVTSSCYPQRMYVFVFFPWDDSYKNYEEYREERVACMKLYALVARYKYSQPKEIVIFGSVTKGATPGSETVMIMDSTASLTPDEREYAQIIMRKEKILDEVSSYKPPTYEGVEIGRNEKCPCGSGMKFKKCHGR